MQLYDFLAPAYDLAFEKIYRPFRERAFEGCVFEPGAVLLELACGTGQNFPMLARRIGSSGHIIGLDISAGMLSRARRRAEGLTEGPQLTLIHCSAVELTPTLLESEAGVRSVDGVICTYGFTSMRDAPAAFRAAWQVLRPGGAFLVHDIHAPVRTLHARAVELATHSRFSEDAWRPLQAAGTDFRMDYLDPSAHLFGGRLFVACGTKPFPLHTPECPS